MHVDLQAGAHSHERGAPVNDGPPAEARSLRPAAPKTMRAPFMPTLVRILLASVLHVSVAAAATGGAACPQAFGSFGPGSPPPACWRPYSPDSPFNRPIPSRSRLANESQAVGAYIRNIAWSFPTDTRNRLALRSDGDRPVYWSRPGDRIVRVTCTGANGFCQRHLFPLKLRIPAGASPALGSDAHMTVVDQGAGREYDFWKAHFAGPRHLVVASGCRLGEGPGLGSGVHGCAEAAGLGLQGGLLRGPELAAGTIDHALAVSIPCTARHRYVWPASYPSGFDCPPGVPAPPLGALLRLRMSPRQIALGHAPGWQRAILTALVRYGMYVVDTEGGGRTMQLISESDLSAQLTGSHSGIAAFIARRRGYYYAPNHDWILDGAPLRLGSFEMIAPCQMRNGCVVHRRHRRR